MYVSFHIDISTFLMDEKNVEKSEHIMCHFDLESKYNKRNRMIRHIKPSSIAIFPLPPFSMNRNRAMRSCTDDRDGQNTSKRTHQDHVATNINDGSHVLAAEGGAALLHDLGQLGAGDLIVLDELANDVGRQLVIREGPPGFHLLLGHGGEGVGHEQAAVVRQAAHDDVAEGQVGLGGTSSRGGVGDGLVGRHGCFFIGSNDTIRLILLLVDG